VVFYSIYDDPQYVFFEIGLFPVSMLELLLGCGGGEDVDFLGSVFEGEIRGDLRFF